MESRYKKYPEYKDSGVEWLGEIPASWRIYESKRIFKNKGMLSLERDEQLAASQKYGVIPQSLMMKLNSSKVMLALKGTSSFRHVDKDDFVISLRSFEGGIEHSNYNGCVSPAYTVLEPMKEISPSFYKYLFKCGQFVSALQSTTDSLRDGKSITFTQFGKIPNIIFDISEANKIAEFLDYETSKIDILIEKQQKLIELLKEKRQAVISHAVTKGLNPNVPMKDSGVEWLGEVPEHWEHSKLRNYLLGIKDGTHSSHKTIDDGKLLLSGKNIKNRTIRITNEERNISDEEHNEIVKNGYPQKGDLLISVVGTIGESCVYEFNYPISFQRSVCFLRTSSFLDVYYLQYLFDSAMAQSQLISLTSQATVGGVYMGDIVELFITLPPIEEQNRIVTLLNLKTQKIDDLMNMGYKQINLLKERRTSLISAAVTGKIDVRGWKRPE